MKHPMRALALALAMTAMACGSSRPPLATNFVVADADGGFDPPGSIDAHGGSVARLHFAVTGDTRPGTADDLAGYPAPIIQQIAERMAARRVQFALDLGDHMYVSSSGTQGAQAQMSLYSDAFTHLGAPLFMTMGNHECQATTCLPGSSDPNFSAFMGALQPVSASPFYAFDVNTGLGLARFVMVADNAWSDDQARWLESTLAEADLKATYTIVARHHPWSDSRFTASRDIIARHKRALVLTGHSHQYFHDLDADPSGRAVVLGTGGAPLTGGWSSFGYGVVTQRDDGSLVFTEFDSTTGAAQDQWSVGPN